MLSRGIWVRFSAGSLLVDVHIQCRYIIPALCGQHEHNTQPHARLPPSFPGIDAWMTSQAKVALIHKATFTWVIDVLGLLHDMLSMDTCSTRHWQTSVRLVQELNVCTVPIQTCGVLRRSLCCLYN